MFVERSVKLKEKMFLLARANVQSILDRTGQDNTYCENRTYSCLNFDRCPRVIECWEGDFCRVHDRAFSRVDDDVDGEGFLSHCLAIPSSVGQR